MGQLLKHWTQNLCILFSLVWTCVSCNSADTPNAEKVSARGASLTQDLKYYDHFPFNHVYTLNLSLGSQNLETVLDTGSANLLVIGDSNNCSGCVNEYGYDSVYTPGASSQKLSSSWEMTFAPIGYANIHGYKDTLSFSGLSLDSYSFGMVTSEEGIPNIWGIAYAQGARPDDNPQTPLFDALALQANWNDQFSLTLCAHKSGSSVTLGGYDSKLSSVMSAVQWTPIVRKRYYSVNLKRMFITSKDGQGVSQVQWTWAPTATSTVIVDSGTNPVVIPPQYISGLVTSLKKVASDNGISIPEDFWPTSSGKGSFATLSDEDIRKFPLIQLEMTDAEDSTKTISLAMSPTVYFQTRDNGQRYLGFQPGNSIVILGTVFMENYVVLHDRGALIESANTARIGFYPVANFCK